MRSSESLTSQSSHSSTPDVTLFRNASINGMSPSPLQLSFSQSQSCLPPEIQQLLQTPNRSINVRIRELHYDISVDSTEDLSRLFQQNKSITSINQLNISGKKELPAIKAPTNEKKSRVQKSTRPLLNLPPPPSNLQYLPTPHLEKDLQNEKASLKRYENLKENKSYYLVDDTQSEPEVQHAKLLPAKSVDSVKLKLRQLNDSKSLSRQNEKTSSSQNLVRIENKYQIQNENKSDAKTVAKARNIAMEIKSDKQLNSTFEVPSNTSKNKSNASVSGQQSKFGCIPKVKTFLDVTNSSFKQEKVPIKIEKKELMPSPKESPKRKQNDEKNAAKTFKKIKKINYDLASLSSSEESELCAKKKPEQVINENAATVNIESKFKNPAIKNLKVEIKTLSIDDMSCGSSCSTVTSDDDSKFFQAARYKKLREIKKHNHRKDKLEKRLQEMSLNQDHKAAIDDKKDEKITIKNPNNQTIYVESSSDETEDDDDYFIQALSRQKMK